MRHFRHTSLLRTLATSQLRFQGFSITGRGKPWEWGWLLQTANDGFEGLPSNESTPWTAIHLLKQSPLLDSFTSGWRRAAEYHRFIQESWVLGGRCAQGQLRCGVGYVTIQVVLSVQEILRSTHDQASRRVKGALFGGAGWWWGHRTFPLTKSRRWKRQQLLTCSWIG